MHVPGGGLLRDSQKWLAPLVGGDGVVRRRRGGAAAARVRRVDTGLAVVPAVVALALPVLLLPDAAAATWATVRPVHYPDDFARVRDVLEHDRVTASGAGAMVLLPWTSLPQVRRGATPAPADDPAWAWFDVPMVGSSALVVGSRRLAEDDPADAALAPCRATDPGAAQVLAAHGVRWVLVYADDPGDARPRR